MLSIYQSEKVAIALKLLQQVKGSVGDKDISKDILLGDALAKLNEVIAAIDEVLQEDLPEGYSYTPPKEEWYSPKSIEKMLPAPTTGDRILNVLGWIAGSSLLSSALCACLSLGAFGISEFKAASGWRDNNNYAAECRGYRGLTFAFLSITLTCGVLGSVIGEAVYRSND